MPNPPQTPLKHAADDPVATQQAALRTLEAQFKEVERDDSQEGLRIRTQLRAKLKALKHDDIHPEEDMVSLDVPAAVTGEHFIISDTEYFGHVVVPACVAQTLLHMIDRNRRVDLARMQESGRTYNLGDIGARARTIQGDD